MLVKELIEELQKLDGEKTIGIYGEDNITLERITINKYCFEINKNIDYIFE